MVVPVSFPSRPADAQLSPRRLGEDDAGVVEVHGAGVAPGARGTPVPRRRAQGELEARRGGGGGRGRGEDWTVDGPGGGGDVDRVRRLALGLVRRVLVWGEEAQCSECSRVILAWVGGGEAEERQGHLGVRRLLLGTCRTGLTVGGLRGAGGLGGALGDSDGLRGVGWSLTTVGLLRRRKKSDLTREWI